MSVVTKIMGITVGGGADHSETTEIHCLVDGEHEHEHVVTTLHSVDVVGYASSGLQTGVGNATNFVIGECTDAIIRVTTTSTDASTVTWTMNDVSQSCSVNDTQFCRF